MKKVRDPQNSTAAEKVKVFRIGLESKGAAKNPLTYPFKKTFKKTPNPPGLIGEKSVGSCVGKVEAERCALRRLRGGQLLQAKGNQVMTHWQLVVLLDLPLSIGIAAFVGPVDQKRCRPAGRKPCLELGRKRNTGGSSRPPHPEETQNWACNHVSEYTDAIS